MEDSNKKLAEEQVVVNETVRKPKNVCGTILPIVLLVAVVVLYVLFFTKKEKTASVVAVAGEHSGLVLTVNQDSINVHFVLVEILKQDLEKEVAKYEAELKPKYAAFEEKYRNFEMNYQNNVLTQTQIQNAQKQLMAEKDHLDALSAKYSEIISKKEISVQRELMDSLFNATKRVNEAAFKADYVFATAEGSAIICSNPAYDITKEVIEELNSAYNKTHKK